MEPIIDHLQITVKDMSVAVPFYDKLLPLLGFDLKNRVSAVIEEHEFHVVEYSHPRLAFAITSPRSAFAGDTVDLLSNWQRLFGADRTMQVGIRNLCAQPSPDGRRGRVRPQGSIRLLQYDGSRRRCMTATIRMWSGRIW